MGRQRTARFGDGLQGRDRGGRGGVFLGGEGAGEGGGGGREREAGGVAGGVEIVGQQEKVAVHEDHQRVAPAVHCEWLEGHEQDQHGDARVFPEQAAELPADRRDGGDHQQGERPARRHSPLLMP